MTYVLLAAALAPAILLMWYVYQKDKVEREPIGLVVRLFILGACAGPVAAILENVLFGVFEAIIPPGTLLIVVEYFVGVAAVEEGLKFLALSTIRKNPNFNYVFDGVVYGVAVALGFAALENVLYVLDGGLGVALTRAILSVPGHCADGVIMGVFFGLARHYEVRGVKSTARLYYLLAFLIPTIEHGIYDTGLSLENDAIALFAMAFGLAFIIFAMVLVNKMAKRDMAIYGTQAPLPNSQVATWQQNPQAAPFQQPGMKQMPQPMPYGQPGVRQAPQAMPYGQTGVQQVPQAAPYQQAGVQQAPQAAPYQQSGAQQVPQPVPYQQAPGQQPYPQQGQQAYPPQGYPQQGYPQSPQQGYPQQSQPQQGYPQQGQPQQGYPQQGYPQQAPFQQNGPTTHYSSRGDGQNH